MRKTGSFPAVPFLLAVLICGPVLAQDPDPRLCSVQGDPVAAPPLNFVDGFCIAPTSSIGSPGGVATIMGEGTFPASADGQLDVFLIWEPDQFDVSTGESFSYSSSLQWSSDKPNARVREWVGNFIPDPFQAFLVTDTDSGLPAEMVKTSTSAVVTDRMIDDSAFPPIPLGRYHVQITGLDAGEMVTFSKSGTGGHIVPEPCGMALLLVGLLSMLRAQPRRRR